MNKRIKQLRKELGLTQQNFADRLRVKRQTIASYEVGKITPSESTLILMCKEFNVNEMWLRTGEGEMFTKLSDDDKLILLVSYAMKEENTPQKRVLQKLSNLTLEQWKALDLLLN